MVTIAISMIDANITIVILTVFFMMYLLMFNMNAINNLADYTILKYYGWA